MNTDQDIHNVLQLPQDRFLRCQHCGVTFAWTGWEQSRATKPDHCKGCSYLLKHTRQWGIIRWIDNRKGFGFISAADGTEIFVRSRHTRKGRLQRGQLVSFYVKQEKMGPQAMNVRKESFRQKAATNK